VPYDERDERNRFRETYSDTQFLEAVRELEIAGTGDVAERVGCSRELARLRLNELADRGDIEKRTVGGRHIFTPVG